MPVQQMTDQSGTGSDKSSHKEKEKPSTRNTPQQDTGKCPSRIPRTQEVVVISYSPYIPFWIYITRK